MADKTSFPLVSIVILNWNGLEDTKLCLEHVHKLDYPNFEIILVDNGSSKDQKEYLSKLKNITYIDNSENRGFAGGQSDGYKQAKGDFIFLLNNDAVIKSDYLKLAMPLFKDPSVAVVGGRSYFWNDEEKLFDTSSRFYAYMDVNPITAETSLRMEDNGVIQEVNVVSGSAVVVRKSVTEKVGYLWEPFFAYYEETDLFARIKRAGYKVLFNPNLHIWHKNGASSGAQSGSPFFYYHIFRNRFMFATRNFDDAYYEQFKVSYTKSMQTALLQAPRGGTHAVVAAAYKKAAKDLRVRKDQLLADRKQLKSSLKNDTYSLQIISEQVSVSFVLDATQLTSKKIDSFINNVAKTELTSLREYIFVVSNDYKQPKTNSMIRFVVNKGYFNSHPINLACIAAKNEWIAILDKTHVNGEGIKKYIDTLVDNFANSYKVIQLTDTTILLRKSFFILVGGLSCDPINLKNNIEYLVKYSSVDNSLLSPSIINMSESEVKTFKSQIHSDYELLSLNKNTPWQRLLNKYYRLQQLNNLVTWGLHPKLPIRLKVGRTKNILSSTLTMNRERLATELKHIRNEVFMQSKLHKVSVLRDDLKKFSQEFTANQIKDPSSIPLFIITFERVDELKKLVTSLEQIGLKNIIFIDNGSTYPPLLDYLKKTSYQVLPLGKNIGHTAPWSQAIIRSLVPLGFYFVTDPDVIPTNNCLENLPIERMLKVHEKYPYHHKVGLSLKIDDLPDHYPLKQSVIDWEKQFWETSLEEGVYEASVDTTFALYKPTTYTYLLGPSIRLGEPYSARHTPWYSNPSDPTPEDTYYKNRADSSVTSWNVDELPERYKKEMERESE